MKLLFRAVLITSSLGLVIAMAITSGFAEEERRSPSPPPVEFDTEAEIHAASLAPVAFPQRLPLGVAFARGMIWDAGGQFVELTYRDEASLELTGAEPKVPPIVILQSATGFRLGSEPQSQIDIQGVTGSLVMGDDIGNPGLAGIYWRKNGITFSAVTFPNEQFTFADFVDFLNSIE